MADKRAIKVSTLDELAEGFQESRGITDKLTMKQMIAFAKEPVGGGENKLAAFISGEITDLVPEDFGDITTVRNNAFAGITANSIILPDSVDSFGSRITDNATISEIKTKAKNIGTFGSPKTESLSYGTNIKIYLTSDTFESCAGLIVNSNWCNLIFNNEAAFFNFIRAGIATNYPFINKTVWHGYFASPDTSMITLNVPSDITQLPDSFLRGLDNVSYINVLGDITSIDNNAFYFCRSLKVINFANCTSVPILKGTSAFSNVSNAQIEVPTALYDDWISATNWSTLASKIVAV